MRELYFVKVVVESYHRSSMSAGGMSLFHATDSGG